MTHEYEADTVSLHSWMILSNRITEKRRLLIAAAAMSTRIISLSRPLVLRPVSPLRNWAPTSWTAMIAIEEGCCYKSSTKTASGWSACLAANMEVEAGLSNVLAGTGGGLKRVTAESRLMTRATNTRVAASTLPYSRYYTIPRVYMDR